MSQDRRVPLSLDISTSVSLAVYSAAVAAGFARVFSGWSFLDDLLVIVVVGHGFGVIARRLRIPGFLAVPALALLLVWAIMAMHYWPTFSWAFPTADTRTVFDGEISLVQDQFRSAVAPVVYGGGWDVLAAIGVAAAVLLADTFAFRAYARAEALVPGGVLFIFVAALGDDRLRIALTVGLIAAGILATIALRTYHATVPSNAVVSGRQPVSIWSKIPTALVMAAVIAILAGLVGPRVPGARAEPIYETRGQGGGVTEVVSPLVDIRSRLTNRSNVEMFVVQANAASYWRLSTLAEFDGTRWELPEREVQPASGVLAEARAGTEEIRHRIRIGALGGSLLPAAPDPVAASGPGDLRWNADSTTLVRIDESLDAGQVFDIVSASPRFDQSVLSAATSTLDGVGDPIYLELPDDFPEIAGATAAAVTAGSDTPYEMAVALQNWFRSEFDYSLEVQSGHGNNALEAFLRDRVGYCEQFAGAYAAMMRSLGVPSRVAVGFTPGREQTDGTFSVLGKNSHAWPEVWFDDLGWVGFEPTPGRGAPGAESYTGVQEQQDGSAPEPGSGDDGTAPAPTVPTDPNATPTSEAPNLPPEDLLDGGSGGDGEATSSRSNGSGGLVWPIAIIMTLCAIAAPAVSRAVSRRRSAESNEAEIKRVWSRARDAVAAVGVEQPDSLTPAEVAEATARQFPVAARPMRSLADAVTRSSFSPTHAAGFDTVGAYGSSTLRDASNWCRQVERAARDDMSRSDRVRRYFTRWR